MECLPCGGRTLRTIVPSNFDGIIQSQEYAVCTFSGHGFGREALLSSGPAHKEAVMSARDEDNFVLPLSTVVLRLGVGEDIRAYGREWPGWDRLRGKCPLW